MDLTSISFCFLLTCLPTFRHNPRLTSNVTSSYIHTLPIAPTHTRWRRAGKIQGHLADDANESRTPLQQKLDEFGRQLSKVDVTQTSTLEGTHVDVTLMRTCAVEDIGV